MARPFMTIARRLKASILPRRLQADIGSTQARLLPENVALVARKPGHSEYAPIIESVYGHHGITVLSSEERTLLEDEINATYKHVMRLKGSKVADAIRKDFANKMWQIDLVSVPDGTISRLKAKNARSAMKQLVGSTEPSEALKEQERTGIKTIRGEAMRAFRDGEISSEPTKAANVVHGPDPSAVKIANWITGFPLDLFILSSHRGRRTARRAAKKPAGTKRSRKKKT